MKSGRFLGGVVGASPISQRIQNGKCQDNHDTFRMLIENPKRKVSGLEKTPKKQKRKVSG